MRISLTFENKFQSFALLYSKMNKYYIMQWNIEISSLCSFQAITQKTRWASEALPLGANTQKKIEEHRIK